VRSALWLAQVFPRRPGDPFGSFLLRLAREMPARGWDITVVAPGDEGAPARGDLDGVHVVRFDPAACGAEGLAYRGEMHRAALRRPAAFLRFLGAFRDAARQALGEVRPALVHAHWWAPSGWIARRVAPDAGVPWVVSLHGTDVRLVRRWRPVRLVARRVLASADAVLPVSEALDREVARWGVAAARRKILPMPADGDLFHPAPAPDADEGPPRFVVVARLTRQKRIADVVEALHRRRDAGPPIALDVVGDGPERPRLEASVRRRGLTGRVTFHGLLPIERLPALYQRSRAVVLPSEEEGYGLAVIEGALCGIPAVVARSGALVELVEHERTGLLVPVGDPGALAGALGRLAADPALAARLGETARAQALARTAAPQAERLAGVYGRVVQDFAKR
jgi:glycogen(starch) synthase